MGRTVKSFKHYRKLMMEMPLPKGMAPDALVPKDSTKNYDNQNYDLETKLAAHGKHLSSGSSRVAYRVYVEKEQFGRKGTAGLHITSDGNADTVIKLAINSNGIAQNEEEIKIYKKFKSYELLLPIIDTSEQHRKKVLVAKGESSTKMVNNWVQMPFATQPDDEHFNHIFNEYFGNLNVIINTEYDADYDEDEDEYPEYSFNQLKSNNISILDDIVSGKVYGANHDQRTHLGNLMKLIHAGLKIGDLSRTDNWGIYQNRPVILDYGFNKNTVGFYNGAKMCEAVIDDSGNLKLIVKDY